jgi:hypothetical protein
LKVIKTKVYVVKEKNLYSPSPSSILY